MKKLIFLVILLVIVPSVFAAGSSHTASQYVGWIDSDIAKFESFGIDASVLLPVRETFVKLEPVKGACGLGCFEHGETLLEAAIGEYDAVVAGLMESPEWKAYAEKEERKKVEIDSVRKFGVYSDKQSFSLNSFYTYIYFLAERDVLISKGFDTSGLSKLIALVPEKYKNVISIDDVGEYAAAKGELIDFYYEINGEAQKQYADVGGEAGVLMWANMSKYVDEAVAAAPNIRPCTIE